MSARTFVPGRLSAVTIATAFLSIASTADAAPAISGVSGAAMHGQLLTLSGSGFGTHADHNDLDDSWQGSQHLAFRFKDFEDGVLNSHGFYPQKGGAPWSVASNELGVRDGGPTNSTKYMTRTYQTGEAGGLSADSSGAGNQLYTSFKLRVAANTQSGKFWRVYADAPQSDVYLSTGCGDFQPRGYSECTAGSCAGAMTEYGGSAPTITVDVWHRVEVWADGPANSFSVWIDGTLGWTKTNWLNMSLGLDGHTLDYPNMIDDASRSASCPPVGSYSFDDIFIDFTRARVELCTAATWAACKKKEVQSPVTWTAGSIGIRVNAGELAAGSTAYLYVVHADGSVNADGYAITLGSTSDGGVAGDDLGGAGDAGLVDGAVATDGGASADGATSTEGGSTSTSAEEGCSYGGGPVATGLSPALAALYATWLLRRRRGPGATP